MQRPPIPTRPARSDFPSLRARSYGYAWRNAFLGFAAYLFVVAANLDAARTAELSEDDLKALYLYNFTQFVTWPQTPEKPPNPLVIGIVGNDGLRLRLEELVKRANPDRQSVEVRAVNAVEEARNCHILFIARSETRRLGGLLDGIEGQPILTVGDDDSFALRGCIIGFYMERDTVHIAVNERAAAKSGVTLSSKLLRIARSL